MLALSQEVDVCGVKPSAATQSEKWCKVRKEELEGGICSLDRPDFIKVDNLCWLNLKLSSNIAARLDRLFKVLVSIFT